jgi:hypothetical protein
MGSISKPLRCVSCLHLLFSLCSDEGAQNTSRSLHCGRELGHVTITTLMMGRHSEATPVYMAPSVCSAAHEPASRSLNVLSSKATNYRLKGFFDSLDDLSESNKQVARGCARAAHERANCARPARWKRSAESMLTRRRRGETSIKVEELPVVY